MNYKALARAALGVVDFPGFLEAALGPPDRHGRWKCVFCPRPTDHPTMYLTPDRRELRCDKCRGHMNALDFAQRHLKLEFLDAVRVIAPSLSVPNNDKRQKRGAGHRHRDGGLWTKRPERRHRRDWQHTATHRAVPSIWDTRRDKMVAVMVDQVGLPTEIARAEADGVIRNCLAARDAFSAWATYLASDRMMADEFSDEVVPEAPW